MALLLCPQRVAAHHRSSNTLINDFAGPLPGVGITDKALMLLAGEARPGRAGRVWR